MTTSITVSEDYLLSLFRLLESRGLSVDDESVPKVHPSEKASYYAESTITIPASEYKELKTAAQEYRTLISALVAAGTSLESIKVLAEPSQPPASHQAVRPALDSARTKNNDEPFSKAHKGQDNDNRKHLNHNNNLHQRFYTQDNPLPTPSPSSEETSYSEVADEAASQASSELPDTNNYRSLILKGLPRSARLADVVKTVRGGMILNLFMRRQHGTAHVAFVEPSAAKRFFIYAKHNELMIKGNVVTVSWDEKQYYMLGGVARRVYQDGATRNLVVRFIKPEITERVIRDDLEHIHTLEVVDLQLRNDHAWISLNSIKHALTAKSCMSSRLRYKGYRIDFWPDECASLPTMRMPQPPQPRQFTQTLRPTAKIFSNRFSMLRNEDSGSESDRDSGL